MKFSTLIAVLTLILSVDIVNSSLETSGLTRFTYKRVKRSFLESFFKEKTTTTPKPPPPKPKPNNLEIGKCEEDDKLIYIDETKIESNNSTLNGVIEIYIDSDHTITCTKVFDQIPDGKGAIPSLNSGGQGEKFVFINVQGQFGHGIHFKVMVRGIIEKKTEKKNKSKKVRN